METLIPIETVENKIYIIRGQKVMLDRDLAWLYEVETKVLNQAVKRNPERFPEDFMFQITKEEFENLMLQNGTSSLRSQFVTSSWGGQRYMPYAFTEHGVAMLSSVLRSKNNKSPRPLRERENFQHEERVLGNWVRGKKPSPVTLPLTLFSNARKPLLAMKTDLSLKGRG